MATNISKSELCNKLHAYKIEVCLLAGDVTYVAEENIATIRGQQQVKHPLIDTYFSGFEDGQYVPTETVRKKYPARPSKASD